MEDRLNTDSAKMFDMGDNGNALGNGRFSNRAARFYWADDEPSLQRAYSIQQVSKISSVDSHFEESPLVIASISAGVIGVAIIIIILVSIWIRSRLYSDEEGRGSGENPHNISVRSSLSTLDEEEAYVVRVEMDGTVLGSMHNIAEADNCCENESVAIEMEQSNDSKVEASTDVPEDAEKVKTISNADNEENVQMERAPASE